MKAKPIKKPHQFNDEAFHKLKAQLDDEAFHKLKAQLDAELLALNK